MQGEEKESAETTVVSEGSDFYEELSQYLEVLSSSTRLKILKCIEKRPKDVRHISSEIQTSYENTKKHLDKLIGIGVVRKGAGIGQPTAKGVHPVWEYSLVPGAFEGIMRNLGVFSTLRPSARELAARLAAVKGSVASELVGADAVAVVLGGSDDGNLFLLQGSTVNIGRSDPGHADWYRPAEDIVLSPSYGAVTRVSKPHARLSAEYGRWFVTDAGSRGGTYLNGRRLPAQEKCVLNDGDTIELGRGMEGARLVIMLPAGRGGGAGT
jgi:DNA-binding transcriptional ArsR family regulator